MLEESCFLQPSMELGVGPTETSSRKGHGKSSALKKETDGCFAPEWSSVRIAACGEEKATDGRSAMGTEVRELREEVESLLYTRQQARHWRYKAD